MRLKANIAGVLIALVLVGCSDSRWYHELELDESTFDAEAMEMVKQKSGLILPQEARGLKFAFKPPMDPAFLAMIEIPEESLDQTVRQIESIEQNRIPSSSGGLDERIVWWHPEEGQVIIDRRTFNAGKSLRAILTRQDGRLILFIDYST